MGFGATSFLTLHFWFKEVMLPDFSKHIWVAGTLFVRDVFSRACFVFSICFLEAASVFVIIFLFSNTTSLCLINSLNLR